MLFYPAERMALFVDGSNIYGSAKGLQFDIDYKRLHELFSKRGMLVRANYYTTVVSGEEFSPLRPLLDYLEYNGWRLVVRDVKEYQDSEGRVRRKGNIDVDLAVDAMETCGTVDHVVLFSGDGDFCPLVAALQRRGKRVTVVSTIKTSPPMCADDLRRMADNFVELASIMTDIYRVGGPTGAPMPALRKEG